VVVDRPPQRGVDFGRCADWGRAPPRRFSLTIMSTRIPFRPSMKHRRVRSRSVSGKSPVSAPRLTRWRSRVVLRIPHANTADSADSGHALFEGGEAAICTAAAGVMGAPRIVLRIGVCANPRDTDENRGHEEERLHGGSLGAGCITATASEAGTCAPIRSRAPRRASSLCAASTNLRCPSSVRSPRNFMKTFTNLP
jgi:hypothetical protein